MDAQKGYISLERAKTMIIMALDQFDQELASRAAHILYNHERLNIVEVAETKTNMMMCRPAGITMDDVKAAGKHMPDFAETFGPHFTRQDNPADYAIVDFEYDGSPRSISWLAHEVGHAIADDIQKENGHSFKDFSEGEMEEQAYFVQRIVSQYLKEKPEFANVPDEDLGQDSLTMSWDRANQFTNANKVYEQALATSTIERSRIALKALDQKIAL